MHALFASTQLNNNTLVKELVLVDEVPDVEVVSIKSTLARTSYEFPEAPEHKI